MGCRAGVGQRTQPVVGVRKGDEGGSWPGFRRLSPWTPNTSSALGPTGRARVGLSERPGPGWVLGFLVGGEWVAPAGEAAGHSSLPGLQEAGGDSQPGQAPGFHPTCRARLLGVLRWASLKPCFLSPENPQSEGTDWPRKGGLLPGNWGIKAGFLDEEDLQLASDP